jgi:hypothetical protein
MLLETILVIVIVPLVTLIVNKVKWASCCGFKCETRETLSDKPQPSLSARIRATIAKLTPRKKTESKGKAEEASKEQVVEIVDQ